MRLGDTSPPTLCLPGPFSSDPINLLSRTRLQGQTQVRPYLWPLLKHWFSSAALGSLSVLPMFVQFLGIMKIIPRYQDVKLFVWAVSWSPGRLGSFHSETLCSGSSTGSDGVRMQELGPHWRQLIIRRLRTTIRLCGRVLAENLAGTLQLTPFKVLNEERRW